MSARRAAFAFCAALFAGGAAGDASTVRVWSSVAGAPDWSAAPAGDLLAIHNPWNHGDLAPGDRFETRLRLAGASPVAWLDVLTGPLTLGRGLPKGAPSLLLGAQFDYRSPADPFAGAQGPGLSLAEIEELSVRVATEDRSGPDASWAKAIQLYGFYAPPGPDWGASIDLDIQIRFASRDFPAPSSFSPSYAGDVGFGGREWRVFDAALAADAPERRYYIFKALFPPETPLQVDLRPFLAWIDRRERSLRARPAPARFPGVSVWIEPRAGAIDTSIGDFGVRLNGRDYGAPAK
ncbi:hypothetical protein [Rubrimonas sp.]|uniref:hypothetical protein n=1 Tax=Rubrimonas sp. TaxID=2036015 RepID=UPI002FDDBD9D